MTSLHYGHRLRGAWPRGLHDEDLRLEKQYNVPESLTPRLYTVGDAVNNGRLGKIEAKTLFYAKD